MLCLGLKSQTIYSVEYKSEADVKVYVTEYKSEADLVICFTEYKSEAGWKKRKKMFLMY